MTPISTPSETKMRADELFTIIKGDATTDPKKMKDTKKTLEEEKKHTMKYAPFLILNAA